MSHRSAKVIPIIWILAIAISAIFLRLQKSYLLSSLAKPATILRVSSTIDLQDGSNDAETFPDALTSGAVHHIASNKVFPPLSTIIDQNNEVTGDASFLLDFAIIGHPKTATSFILQWLASHPEIQTEVHEVNSLSRGDAAALIQRLYNLPRGKHFKRGYKAPRDILLPKAMNAIAQYWPNTGLIVGVRHPVLWFESFYNFRVRSNVTMPPPETLNGVCSEHSYNVCADESLFHLHLSLLGKTNRSDRFEQKLLNTSPLGGQLGGFKTINKPFPNKVFLYELGQLYDSNHTRRDQYRLDVSSFLGLKEPLSPIKDGHKSRNAKWALDICEPRYTALRGSLMNIARPASIWIREYFLRSPDVMVSSQQHFKDLLGSWLKDPCEDL